MNYYLDLAAEFGALARWRMAAVLYAADYVQTDELPMEAALLLAADPSADVVELAGRYRDDDHWDTRDLFERSTRATLVGVPMFGDSWSFVLCLDAARIQRGELPLTSIFRKDFDYLGEYPRWAFNAYTNLAEYIECGHMPPKYDPMDDISSLASMLDGRRIPEWLALLTDPSRDSPAFAGPVPEEKPGRRGRGTSLAARAIRRIRGGRSA
jgi:hypothetical protein